MDGLGFKDFRMDGTRILRLLDFMMDWTRIQRLIDFMMIYTSEKWYFLKWRNRWRNKIEI